ncbi:MAG TPA: anti-sigma factor, partial [Mycobacterium sp.]|nr:anti-sigma factor [Mycobacterium sp.]
MTEPIESPLLDAATAYALHAVSEAERADIERQVAEAPQSVAEAFGDEVRAVQETMAIVSVFTAAQPPAHLRVAVLGDVHPGDARSSRW